MFVDASAWVAVILREPECDAFMNKLAEADQVLTSAAAGWEAVRAVTRATSKSTDDASSQLRILQRGVDARIVPIGEREQAVALEAHARFGNGVHPAKLNMGDCFAYACARTNGVSLLFKGDDFGLTDIEPA